MCSCQNRREANLREMLSTPSSLALVPYIHINRLVIELQRSRVYTFPPLNDCRGQFADMMQQNIKWDGPEDTRQMRGTARVQLAKMRLDEATGSFVYKRKRAKPLI